MAIRLKKRNQRIGETMVDAGLLTEEDLGYAVARQARQIVLSAYNLKTGLYSFDERPCFIPMDLRLSLSVYRMQLEGIRKMTKGDLILQGIGAFERPIRPSAMPPFSYDRSELWSVECNVLDASETASGLNDILEAVDGKRIHVLRAAYGLLRAGILVRPNGSHAKQKVQEEMGTFLLSSIGKDLEKTIHPLDVRQEVLLRFDSLESASPSELLEVGEDADEEEIQRAVEAKQSEWKKKQALLKNERSLLIKVEEIRERLARARSELLEQEEAPADSKDADFSEPDGVFGFALVDDSPPEEDENSREEGLGTGIASDNLSEPSTKEEIERLLYDMKIRKAVNDTEGVVSLLYEIVKLDPQNAKYESMLARALASHPVLRNKAERHFRRALALDPQNADLHFALGRFYQSFDIKGRALSEYKTALRINPNHVEARKAVVEMKQNGSSSMDKVMRCLFG
jgi:tetratricopeptide (TPR) repeat protein